MPKPDNLTSCTADLSAALGKSLSIHFEFLERARSPGQGALIPERDPVKGTLIKSTPPSRTVHRRFATGASGLDYLNEFVFRCKRRRSCSRGLLFYRVLELAVAQAPVRDHDLAVTRRPRAVHRVPPHTYGHPSSLERALGHRPWRESG